MKDLIRSNLGCLLPKIFAGNSPPFEWVVNHVSLARLGDGDSRRVNHFRFAPWLGSNGGRIHLPTSLPIDGSELT